MAGPSQPRSIQRSNLAGSTRSARAIPHRSKPSDAALRFTRSASSRGPSRNGAISFPCTPGQGSAKNRAMARLLAYLFRLAVALLLGGDFFLAVVAAPAAFPRDIASLPPGSWRGVAAADLVGRMLIQLDRMTLVLTGVAALCAIALARNGFARARTAALPVLAAGLSSLFSAAWVTPRIHTLRTLGESAGPEFGRLHFLSTAL